MQIPSIPRRSAPVASLLILTAVVLGARETAASPSSADQPAATTAPAQRFQLLPSLFLRDGECFDECFPVCQDICLHPPGGDLPAGTPGQCFDFCQTACTRACPPRFQLVFERAARGVSRAAPGASSAGSCGGSGCVSRCAGTFCSPGEPKLAKSCLGNCVEVCGSAGD